MKFILPKSCDARFACLARRAEESGLTTIQYTHKIPHEQGIFFFPLSFKESDCISALRSVPENSTVFFGKASENVKKSAAEKGIRLHCLLENEHYLSQNAVHTAEGTLAELIANTDRRLDELCLLVYGYGNCGRAIANLLWLCGVEVWVWSRARGQARALQDGFNLYPAPQKGLSMFDGVINTVPDPIFPKSFLSTLQKDSFFFQIASGSSGISPEVMEELGVRFFLLHGLPGKYCPASDGDALWEVVESILKQTYPGSTS